MASWCNQKACICCVVALVVVQIMVNEVYHLQSKAGSCRCNAGLKIGSAPQQHNQSGLDSQSIEGDKVFVTIENKHLLKSPHLRIFFGNNEAPITKRDEKGVVCSVPKSDFDGIGWNTTVRVKACASGICDSQPNRTFTYPASNPPARVANVGLMWLTKNSTTALKVVELFVHRLGPDWRFQFMMFPGVEDFYLSTPLFQQLIDQGRLVYETIEKQTRRQYALKCVDPAYWQRVQGDRVLVFQEDSVPCSKASHSITDFFKYDYIGAPWPWYPFVGNGGLSLRNRTALIRLLNENKDEVTKQSSNPKWYMEDYTIGLPTHHRPQLLNVLSWRAWCSCFVCCLQQGSLQSTRRSFVWHRPMRASTFARSGFMFQGPGVPTKFGEL